MVRDYGTFARFYGIIVSEKQNVSSNVWFI